MKYLPYKVFVATLYICMPREKCYDTFSYPFSFILCKLSHYDEIHHISLLEWWQVNT